jgi:dTDP-4-dehydrorhamnose 3,5-epimerase-like enzyme
MDTEGENEWPLGVLAAAFVREDDRGTFVEMLNREGWGSLVMGCMKRGSVIGNHFHKETDVFFSLMSGRVRMRAVHVETSARRDLTIGSNEGVFLPRNESHALEFLDDSLFVMLKSIPYDVDRPDTYPFPVEVE